MGPSTANFLLAASYDSKCSETFSRGVDRVSKSERLTLSKLLKHLFIQIQDVWNKAHKIDKIGFNQSLVLVHQPEGRSGMPWGLQRWPEVDIWWEKREAANRCSRPSVRWRESGDLLIP